MIHCIFTLDYEIYGNGEGSLQELIYEPAEKLRRVFSRWNARFVNFVELAELDIIEAHSTDKAIGMIKEQLQHLYSDGFELGLHLHPQWYNAKYDNGSWLLDYTEYNLCKLPHDRITQIVNRSISYLQGILGEPSFIPVSFRAGNWLFQPTSTAAGILSKKGIKVDSSVFKGGLQHEHNLDYRRSLKNGYYWRFTQDANVPEPKGILLELPIYTQMVPTWKMLTTKRIGLQKKGFTTAQAPKRKTSRYKDFLRLRYPLKFDFCRMTINELKNMIKNVIKEDQRNPEALRPIVAIGHTKDLVDLETLESFLSFLNRKKIMVSTFQEIYNQYK